MPLPAAARGRDRLILALDTPLPATALAWCRQFQHEVGLVKIGLELFVAAGPEIVRQVRQFGLGVFLDLKFHDIPNTMAGAVRAAAALDVQMLNVHAAAGPAALRAAAAACRETGAAAPILLGVTVLTSLDETSLSGLGIAGPVTTRVVAWAEQCQAAGLGGVVASPQEAALIRRACGADFKIVTPGIRPATGDRQDQRRVLSAGDAVRSGADYLVVGRAITAAADPAAAARALAAEVDAAHA